MGYWNRKAELKQKAIIHTQQMEEQYRDEILRAEENTKTYTDVVIGTIDERYTGTGLVIADIDSVSALFWYKDEGIFEPDDKTALLNFASYKEPCGMFLSGSSAQEESLCHESFLYNVLSRREDFYQYNRTKLNKALYTNRALYTLDVRFIREERSYLADVITCAAPNKGAAQKYCQVTDNANYNSLYSRIDFILHIAYVNKVDNLILGAYGCGVFGQDPEIVAKIFRIFLLTSYHNCFKTVVFAIPNSVNGGNYNAFCKVFKVSEK